MSVGGDLSLGFIRVVQDPIFWPHHANIDRVWESWNRLGHQNPTDPKWLDRKFAFPDRNSNRVDVPVSAVNRLAQLGYEYDRYEQPPKPGTGPPKPAATPLAQTSPVSREVDTPAAGRSPAPAWSLLDGSGKTVSLSQYKGRQLVLIFYEGYGCIRCMEQLNNFAAKSREFAALGIDLVAISTDVPEDLKNALADYEKEGGFPIPLVSDAKLEIFKAYGCSESGNLPLHGTFLIDAQGRFAGGISATGRSTTRPICWRRRSNCQAWWPPGEVRRQQRNQ